MTSGRYWTIYERPHKTECRPEMKDGFTKEIYRKRIAKSVAASSVGIQMPEKPIAMYLELLWRLPVP